MIGAIDTVIARVIARVVGTATRPAGYDPRGYPQRRQYFQFVPVPRYCSTGMGSTPGRIRSR